MAVLFSIIRTTKINLLDVQVYMQYALENCTNGDIKKLLPYSQEMKKKLSLKL